jgi:hypothetical protein
MDEAMEGLQYDGGINHGLYMGMFWFEAVLLAAVRIGCSENWLQ